MSEHDKKFVRNIAIIVVVMIVFVIALVVATGRGQEEMASESPTPGRDAALAERIKPVGEVYSGDTGRQALEEAQAQAAETQTVAAAFDGTLDGSVIYDNVCGVCHNIGAGGAPLMQKDAWADRIAQGNDVLVQHAIEGYQGSAGVMPAKGGRMDLTDEQVRASVEHMLGMLE